MAKHACCLCPACGSMHAGNPINLPGFVAYDVANMYLESQITVPYWPTYYGCGWSMGVCCQYTRLTMTHRATVTVASCAVHAPVQLAVSQLICLLSMCGRSDIAAGRGLTHDNLQQMTQLSAGHSAAGKKTSGRSRRSVNPLNIFMDLSGFS